MTMTTIFCSVNLKNISCPLKRMLLNIYIKVVILKQKGFSMTNFEYLMFLRNRIFGDRFISARHTF